MEPKESNSMDNQPKERVNPYKELKPYEEGDTNNFYGRTEDIYNLFHQVKFNFLSVVFGKAGIGKTSLLNAGLFPVLREEGFLPVRLRLNYAKEALPLVEQIRQGLMKEIEVRKVQIRKDDEKEASDPMEKGESLWEYFHRTSHFDFSGETMVTPVLVIDQFEEIFTLGKEHANRETFIEELYWLIENQLPLFLRQRMLKGDKEFPFSTTRPNVRMIISLREDYVPHLLQLKSPISSIDRNMFRVIHLNGKQAREVIGMPGGLQGQWAAEDILRCFYPDGARDVTIPDEALEIEPTFLSLLCYQLFEKKNLGSITKEDLEKILGDFYNDRIKPYPEEVKLFIESKLLTEGGFRTPFYLDIGHLMRPSIDELVGCRVLRRFYEGKKEYIEIIHDVLAPIIKEKRNKRLEQEQKQKLKKEFYQNRKNIIIAFLSALLVVLITLTFYAFYQKNRADKEYMTVKSLKLSAEAKLEVYRDNTRAIRIAEAAYKVGLPKPLPQVFRALSETGYSSLEEPFYTATLIHKDSINTAVFSPDGTSILTASDDHTAKLWDMKGGLLADLNKHEKAVKSAAFSSDGIHILTVSMDGSVKLWDIKGNLLFGSKGLMRVISTAVLSLNGTLILTASSDGTAKLWDVRGNLLLDLIGHKRVIKTAVFSPDGTHFLTSSLDGTTKLWDIKGNLLFELKGHKMVVRTAVFSPDGNFILTASLDGVTKLWNMRGNLLCELKGPDKRLVRIAIFSPNGAYILTASDDVTVRLWDMKGELLADLSGHKDSINSVAFSPDGAYILTASDDKTAKLWDMKGNLLADLNKHKKSVYSAVFSPDGANILTASEDGTARLWNIIDKPQSYIGKNENIYSAVFSPDGTQILTTSKDGTAQLWDVRGMKGNLRIELRGHSERIYSTVFSPDGTKILTASEDGTAKLWDRKGKLWVDLKGHLGRIYTAVFSPDGNQILTASRDQTAKLWDIKGHLLVNLNMHVGSVFSAVFSPNGTQILTASEDGTAKLWDRKGKLLLDLNGHLGAVYTAVFSPDGTQILTASEDGTAKLWNMRGELKVDLCGHLRRIYTAVFSPDGTQILTTSKDGTAKLWNVLGNLLADLNSPTGVVKSALFSSDGSQIITASEDYTVKLWNVKGNLLADLNKHKGIVTSAMFSPDETRILTTSQDGKSMLWYTPEAIYKWLKTAPIQQLSEKDKKELGIQ